MHREYYINDAGRQVDIIAVSVWLRYLEAWGEEFRFPANGYKGDYVRGIAAQLQEQAGQMLARPEIQIFSDLPPDEPDGGDKETYIDALIARAKDMIGEVDFRDIAQLALKTIIADMENDLAEFGVVYDRWYSEASLSENGRHRPCPGAPCASRTTSMKRTARCGSAPPPSATRRTGWWCARTA